MDILQTVDVGASGAASITFSGIPADYTDLLIVVSARGGSDAIRIYFNGANSDRTGRLLQGDGANTNTFGRTDSFSGYVSSTAMTSSTFGSTNIYIPNYRSSAIKNLKVDSVAENNATFALQTLYAGLWNQTSPITSVVIEMNNGTSIFNEHSTASIYGILAGSSGGVTVS